MLTPKNRLRLLNRLNERPSSPEAPTLASLIRSKVRQEKLKKFIEDSPSQSEDYLCNPKLPQLCHALTSTFTQFFSIEKDKYDTEKNKLIESMKRKKVMDDVHQFVYTLTLRSFIKRMDTPLQSALLLNHSLDGLFTLYFYFNQWKRELRQFKNNYELNKVKKNKLYESLTFLDEKKSIIKEEVDISTKLYDIYHMTTDPELKRIEGELLQLVLFIPAGTYIPTILKNINKTFDETTLEQVYKTIMDYLEDHRYDKYILTFILSIGLNIVYHGNYKLGSSLIYKSLDLYDSLNEALNMKYFLNHIILAFAFRFEQKYKSSSEILFRICHGIIESDQFNNPETYVLLINLAFLIDKYTPKSDYFRLILEDVLTNLIDYLPNYEKYWMTASLMLAQYYNTIYDDKSAQLYIIKPLEYFQKRSNGNLTSHKNKPIYEVALDSINERNSITALIETISPKVTYVPKIVQNLLKEYMITFILMKNFNGVKIIERFLKNINDSFTPTSILMNEMDFEDELSFYQLKSVQLFNNIKWNNRKKINNKIENLKSKPIIDVTQSTSNAS